MEALIALAMRLGTPSSLVLLIEYMLQSLQSPRGKIEFRKGRKPPRKSLEWFRGMTTTERSELETAVQKILVEADPESEILSIQRKFTYQLKQHRSTFGRNEVT